MTNAEIAQKLKTYNEWRRGEGKYDKGGEPCPIEPKELGVVIDLAAKRLESAQLLTETLFDNIAGDDHASDRALGRLKGGKDGKKAGRKRRTHEG